jgi:hypothetical protein
VHRVLQWAVENLTPLLYGSSFYTFNKQTDIDMYECIILSMLKLNSEHLFIAVRSSMVYGNAFYQILRLCGVE